jgi:hypothetical protein
LKDEWLNLGEDLLSLVEKGGTPLIQDNDGFKLVNGSWTLPGSR